MNTHLAKEITSPVGNIRVLAGSEGICGVYLATHKYDLPSHDLIEESHELLDTACAQLHEYFEGTRHTFALPLEAKGTEFQRDVWRALQDIPPGETRSYGQLAAAIGRPKAVRALGSANGKNPIGIIVPCHRVIGANGTLTGYAGGVDAKAWLLQHERTMRP